MPTKSKLFERKAGVPPTNQETSDILEGSKAVYEIAEAHAEVDDNTGVERPATVLPEKLAFGGLRIASATPDPVKPVSKCAACESGDCVAHSKEASPHDDAVAELTQRIQKKVKELKRDGTVGMSAANLKQILDIRGLRFANPNHFERSFNESLEKAGLGRFITASKIAAGGRGWGPLKPGEPITDLSQVDVGSVILGISHQFSDSKNTYIVSNIWPDKMYIKYINADDWQEDVMDSHTEMCVWDHDLKDTNREEFFIAIFPEKQKAPDKGTEGLPLFDKSSSKTAAEMTTAKALKLAEDLQEDLQAIYMKAKPLTQANETRTVREGVESIYVAMSKLVEAQKVLAKQVRQEEVEAQATEEAEKRKKKSSKSDMVRVCKLCGKQVKHTGGDNYSHVDPNSKCSATPAQLAQSSRRSRLPEAKKATVGGLKVAGSLDSDFYKAYVEAALWSSLDESDESGGDPLDQNYGPEDIAPQTVAAMEKDCEEFQSQNAELLSQYYEALPLQAWSPEEQAGYDFWLSRNGHGAGFFDRDVPDEIKDTLQEAARKFGTFDLYVGDDDMIYAFGHEGPLPEAASKTPSKLGGLKVAGTSKSKACEDGKCKDCKNLKNICGCECHKSKKASTKIAEEEREPSMPPPEGTEDGNGWVTAKVQGRNLIISLTPEGKEELADLHEQYDPPHSPPWGEDDFFHEICQGWLGNGDWDWVRPEEVGALTDSPLIAYDKQIADNGDLVDVGQVYWFPNHQIESPLETLETTGSVTFRHEEDIDKQATSRSREVDDVYSSGATVNIKDEPCDEYEGHLKPWGKCHNCGNDYSAHAEYDENDFDESGRMKEAKGKKASEEYRINVQCKDENSGETGTFITRAGEHKAITPVFDGLHELFPYMRENGWASQEYEGNKFTPWKVVKINKKAAGGPAGSKGKTQSSKRASDARCGMCDHSWDSHNQPPDFSCKECKKCTGWRDKKTASSRSNDRVQFSHLLKEHSPNVQSGVVHKHVANTIAEEMMRLGHAYKKIQGLWLGEQMDPESTAKFQNQEHEIEEKIQALATQLGVTAVFDADPKVATIKLNCPDGFSNDDRKQGLVVPTA